MHQTCTVVPRFSSVTCWITSARAKATRRHHWPVGAAVTGARAPSSRQHVVGPIFSPDSSRRAASRPGNVEIGSRTRSEEVLEAVRYLLERLILPADLQAKFCG